MCFDCRLSFLGSKGWDKQFILIKPQAVPHAEMHLLKSFDERGRDEKRKRRRGRKPSRSHLHSVPYPGPKPQVLERKVDRSTGNDSGMQIDILGP